MRSLRTTKELTRAKTTLYRVTEVLWMRSLHIWQSSSLCNDEAGLHAPHSVKSSVVVEFCEKRQKWCDGSHANVPSCAVNSVWTL